ncbi:MAG: DUF1207 domain-containing protein [Gemmatimonadota bacterium]
MSRAAFRSTFVGIVWAVAALCIPSGPARAQQWLFPARELLPELLAAPRAPVNKGELLLVPDDPSRYASDFSADVAIGRRLALLRFIDHSGRDTLVIGAQGAAFARFTPHITVLELVNTDWEFAVPIVWRHGGRWLRLRYLHTSSHLGDEYASRFGLAGVNFSRDGAEVMGYIRPAPVVGLYAGTRYDVNVHPEAAKRWVVRAGLELQKLGIGTWQPYLAADVQSEQDTAWQPTLTVQAGLWLPDVEGRRALRLALDILTGPSPLGQFHGRHTSQIGLALLLSS